MRSEISIIIDQLRESYEGDPWFGRSLRAILGDVDPATVFEKPNGQHSLLDLLWHLITWREFTIDRLQHSPQMQEDYFERNDWRPLDENDKTLWPQGLERLQETQDQLLKLLAGQEDELLEARVREREYDFRKLLYGIVQHDIYHLGQIAYLRKLLEAKS